MKLGDFFFNTSQQRILKFLADFPNKSFFEKEISQRSRVSRGATNTALKRLTQAGLIVSEKRGRMSFYSVDLKNPLIKQWKVLNNIIKIYSLVKRIRTISDKVILFGSAADGINIKESDIDLFVLTNFPNEVREIISKYKSNNIQLIVKKPLEFVEMKSKSPVFYEEIAKGIVLWEKTE